MKRGIAWLSSLPKTPVSAIALVTSVSALACWLNWGFGLIVGVIFAKDIARRLQGVDYRLLIASAYSGFVVWHAGLSGSVPLKLATPGPDLAAATSGAIVDPLPISDTIFHPYNLVMVLLVIVAITVVNAMMHPKGSNIVVVDPSLLEEADVTMAKPSSSPTPAQRVENSRLLTWLISLLGLSFVVINLCFKKGAFDLGMVIMIFLFLGLLFHGTPV
ncbi:MAG: short-chain fatty acid transporter, partial [Bacteroidales bacterium]|nr:short-chain fatty acid transporter [Bacteroidales bacterium]